MEEIKYSEDLKFDRRAKCDWCGERKRVAVCHYGTTHYNRLVCPACAKKINEANKMFSSIPYFNPETLEEK